MVIRETPAPGKAARIRVRISRYDNPTDWDLGEPGATMAWVSRLS